MPVSSIVLLIWVLLVSFTIRGWFPTQDLGWWTLVAGIAYVVIRILEFTGIWSKFVNKSKAPAKTE